MVAAAVVGGAVISAGASSYSSKKASKAQSKSVGEGNQIQWDMYEQTRADQAPWRQAGEVALRQQMALLGLQMPEPGEETYEYPGGAQTYSIDPQGNIIPNYTTQLQQDQAVPLNAQSQKTPLEILQATPGYQFQMDQGLKALDRSASARGLLRSGRQQKALMEYGQGLASTTFGDYLNRLAAISGTGQTSAQSIGTAGLATAGNIASGLQLAGQAQATNAINQGNNFANLVNQGTQLYAMSNFNRPASADTYVSPTMDPSMRLS